MPALSFFVGKGGVGKTTVSAAYAVYRAQKKPRRPVLLMSTDPAHSLADVFETKFDHQPRRVAGAGQLTVWQVDAQRQFRKFLDRYREPIVSLLESGTMFTRQEIEPLLDTTLPGMAEMAALLAIHEMLAAKDYAEIVVDTAPIGHTLRLFEMPEYFARFLDLLDLSGSRDQVLAEHFGGAAAGNNPFLEEWRRMVAAVQEALHERQSRIVMVTSPEHFSLNESVRTAQAMGNATSPLEVTEVIVNRAVRRAGACPACQQSQARAQDALRFVKRHFRQAVIHVAEDMGGPVAGATQLGDFGRHIFNGKPAPRLTKAAASRQEPKLKRVPWPALATRITWTCGKGGVGKTTISAAMAVHQRQQARSRPVIVCSTDPAPSLDDVFGVPIGNDPVNILGDRKLQAAELDAAAEFRAWAREVKGSITQAFSSDVRGVHVDLSFERRILTALLDMVPPGVDEIMAIFRILDFLGKQEWLVVDMAPTGHALELLRMPDRILLWSRLLLKSLAPHRRMALARDVAVQIARLSHRVRELASMLKDGRSSRVIAVMLAEPLPDRETIRLLRSLEELGITTTALFVNRVRFAEDASHCRRCQTARQWQLATLSGLRRRNRGKKIYVVRNRAGEIAGAKALKSFTGELWQIV